MKYLLDTDIISNLLRRTPSTALISRLAAVPPEDQFISSITLGELVYGAYWVSEQPRTLLERLDKTLLPNLPVLPFDAAAARKYGEIRADLASRGASMGDTDLRIAAIALARELTIVTGHPRSFQRIPELSVENWLAE